jgi:two-component system LytT family response regulator
MKELKALIVDDEPPARKIIQRMITELDGISSIGECANGREAIGAIVKHSPDIVFLDIQMPELDGLSLIEAIDPARLPAVVFVTAFDEYAVKAFEIDAVDYLLKPFDHERFAAAVERARRGLQGRRRVEQAERVLTTLGRIGKDPNRIVRFVVKERGRMQIIKAADVSWIESCGNYVVLHSPGRQFIVRETMKNVDRRLDPDTFTRIHRSTIVNIDRIKELQVQVSGDLAAILECGTELPISRRFRTGLESRLRTAL